AISLGGFTMRMISVSSLSLLARSLRLKELVRGRARLGWMTLVLAASAFALIAGAGTEKTASPSLRGGSDAGYCGPSRAVLRVDGKVFRFKHGTCQRNGGGVGFGWLAYGKNFPNGRGMWLRLQRVGTNEQFWHVRAGRYSVVDGEVQ